VGRAAGIAWQLVSSRGGVAGEAHLKQAGSVAKVVDIEGIIEAVAGNQVLCKLLQGSGATVRQAPRLAAGQRSSCAAGGGHLVLPGALHVPARAARARVGQHGSVKVRSKDGVKHSWLATGGWTLVSGQASEGMPIHAALCGWYGGDRYWYCIIPQALGVGTGATRDEWWVQTSTQRPQQLEMALGGCTALLSCTDNVIVFLLCWCSLDRRCLNEGLDRIPSSDAVGTELVQQRDIQTA
jgi:hypothetical protein